jgi:transmembrane sensor
VRRAIPYLNAHSVVRATFTQHTRDLRLLEGEALFQVAHDGERPFRVRTLDATVRAVGTRFNVDARQTRTVVSVLEGKVEVQAERTALMQNP